MTDRLRVFTLALKYWFFGAAWEDATHLSREIVLGWNKPGKG